VFRKFIGLSLLLGSISAFAQSNVQLDYPVYLNDCRGSITLNQAADGDLSIQLRNVDTDRCPFLTMNDASSGRLIKTYEIQGTSYTLSKQMLASLSQDCRLNFNVSGSFWSSDNFVVYIPWCVPQGNYGRSEYPHSSEYPRSSDYSRVTYEWSNNGNCKKMVNGSYSGENVSESLCSGVRPRGDYGPRISYEWSNKHNCKKMINGAYSGENVSDFYCR
jgi:hypothetical protein